MNDLETLYITQFTWYDNAGLIHAGSRTSSTEVDAKIMARQWRSSGVVPLDAIDLEASVQRCTRPFNAGPEMAWRKDAPVVIVAEGDYELPPGATDPAAIASSASAAWWGDKIREQLATSRGSMFAAIFDN